MFITTTTLNKYNLMEARIYMFGDLITGDLNAIVNRYFTKHGEHGGRKLSLSAMFHLV